MNLWFSRNEWNLGINLLGDDVDHTWATGRVRQLKDKFVDFYRNKPISNAPDTPQNPYSFEQSSIWQGEWDFLLLS